MFCSSCGKELEDGAKFCSSCGKPVGKTISVPNISLNIDRDNIKKTVTTNKNKILLGSFVVFMIFFTVFSFTAKSTVGIVGKAKRLLFFGSDYTLEEVLKATTKELKWKTVKIGGKTYVEASGALKMPDGVDPQYDPFAFYENLLGSEFSVGFYFTVTENGGSLKGGYMKSIGMSEEMDSDDAVSMLKRCYDIYGLSKHVKKMGSNND